MKRGNLFILSGFVIVLSIFAFLFLSQTPSQVLLSFDVEPVDGNESVIALLDVLYDTDIQATFFFLGEYAEQYPEVVKRAYDGGHEVACHGYSHKPFTKLSSDEKIKELTDCKNIILGITNMTNEMRIGFRAPYNRIDKETYSIVKEEFAYDATQISGYGIFYPDAGMDEIKVSSIFLIPAEDVIWMYYLHMPAGIYFSLLEHKCCTASYLFHPHHLDSGARLEAFKELIKDLKALNVTFIKHIDFILLQNDNS